LVRGGYKIGKGERESLSETKFPGPIRGTSYWVGQQDITEQGGQAAIKEGREKHGENNKNLNVSPRITLSDEGTNLCHRHGGIGGKKKRMNEV